MNFRPMVKVGNEWAGNAVVFATYEEAIANARNLMSRWSLVVDTRVDETSEPVSHRWVDHRMVAIEKASVH